MRHSIHNEVAREYDKCRYDFIQGSVVEIPRLFIDLFRHITLAKQKTNFIKYKEEP